MDKPAVSRSQEDESYLKDHLGDADHLLHLKNAFGSLFRKYLTAAPRLHALEARVAELEAERCSAPKGSDHELLESIARRVAGPRTTTLSRPDGSRVTISTHGDGRGGHVEVTDAHGATTHHGTVSSQKKLNIPGDPYPTHVDSKPQGD